MNVHAVAQLTASAIGFFAGIGAHIMWLRYRGFTIDAKKEPPPCGS